MNRQIFRGIRIDFGIIGSGSDGFANMSARHEAIYVLPRMFFATIKNNLEQLGTEIDKTLPAYKDAETIGHLKEVRERIKYTLQNTRSRLNEDRDAEVVKLNAFTTRWMESGAAWRY